MIASLLLGSMLAAKKKGSYHIILHHIFVFRFSFLFFFFLLLLLLLQAFKLFALSLSERCFLLQSIYQVGRQGYFKLCHLLLPLSLSLSLSLSFCPTTMVCLGSSFPFIFLPRISITCLGIIVELIHSYLGHLPISL